MEESKGGRSSGPRGIETEIRALGGDNIELLKEGEVILYLEGKGGERPAALPPNITLPAPLAP